MEVAPARRSRGPSPERTARTRAAILAAALDEFLDGGFAATRMADVAARAGLAKGTLYLHFADKEALFEGVLRGLVEAPLAGLAAAAPAEGEAVRDFLLRVLRPVLRDMEASRRGAVIRLVVAEGGRFPAIAAMYRRIVIAPGLAAIGALAARAAAAGELRGEALLRHPPLLVAPVVLAVLWNGLFAAGDPMDAEAMFEAQLDLLFPVRGSHPAET
ncbi:TetR/AcrR family transcriptional regulator [Paracraurococcus lichenis]|uniref:Helix-turn-helix domain-containing protein n=1 Tax=Paracraurococcus lichenis TaxID=3064888 RepID=A0ABT9E256_9PROT|nr:TetR/AcrR family transcriptional regulator [Paracraurococcus sp. LOR1-02]MDO9710219.1 helix-turn-helix domain-containing protein [Paracraurococcus sp. LOR1-02]